MHRGRHPAQKQSILDACVLRMLLLESSEELVGEHVVALRERTHRFAKRWHNGRIASGGESRTGPVLIGKNFLGSLRAGLGSNRRARRRYPRLVHRWRQRAAPVDLGIVARPYPRAHSSALS